MCHNFAPDNTLTQLEVISHIPLDFDPQAEPHNKNIQWLRLTTPKNPIQAYLKAIYNQDNRPAIISYSVKKIHFRNQHLVKFAETNLILTSKFQKCIGCFQSLCGLTGPIKKKNMDTMVRSKVENFLS